MEYKTKYNNATFREEIDCIISKEIFNENFKKATDEKRKTVSYKGFRKGNVPDNILLSNFFKEISDLAISISVDEAVKKLPELDSRPLEPLTVDKIDFDKDGNLQVYFSYIPVPTVIIGDLSSIKVPATEPRKVTEDEVEKELGNIWFNYIKNYNSDIKREDYSKEKVDVEFFEKSGITKDNPELTSYDALKKFISDYIQNTYNANADIEWRRAVETQLIEHAKFEKVEGIIAKELESKIQNYKQNFANLGLNPDDYLKEKNVDLESLRAEWKPAVEKDVKFELILQKHGEDKKFEPTEEEIAHEMTHLDPETKKRYNNNVSLLKSLIRYYYINQKAFNDIVEKIKANAGASAKSNIKTKKK